MKILLINNFHYYRGGSESVYFNTADELSARGHEVHFFSFKRSENIPCQDDAFFPVYPYRGNVFSRILKNVIYYFYNFEAAKKLDAFLAHQKFDIAHVHLIFGGLTPSILAVLKKRHIPVVYTAHDYRLVCPAYTFRDGAGKVCEACKGKHFYHCISRRCAKGSFAKSIMMAAEMYFRNLFLSPFNLFSGFIFVSNFSKNKHLDYAPKLRQNNVLQAYNFLPGSSESLLSQIHRTSAEDYFLFYGRLSPEKGVDLLVDVFSKHPELNLIIVGTGPTEAHLRSELEKRSAKNIVMLGYKTGLELKELIANARFVLIPSEWYENNPMTVIESFQLGIPVIGSNLGGIPELMDNGANGFLFEAGDPASLETVLKKVQDLSPSDYSELKKNCRSFFEKSFPAEHHIQKLVSFYLDVINQYNTHN